MAGSAPAAGRHAPRAPRPADRPAPSPWQRRTFVRTRAPTPSGRPRPQGRASSPRCAPRSPASRAPGRSTPAPAGPASAPGSVPAGRPTGPRWLRTSAPPRAQRRSHAASRGRGERPCLRHRRHRRGAGSASRLRPLPPDVAMRRPRPLRLHERTRRRQSPGEWFRTRADGATVNCRVTPVRRRVPETDNPGLATRWRSARPLVHLRPSGRCAGRRPVPSRCRLHLARSRPRNRSQ